jgi:hypothetical protein
MVRDMSAVAFHVLLTYVGNVIVTDTVHTSSSKLIMQEKNRDNKLIIFH